MTATIPQASLATKALAVACGRLSLLSTRGNDVRRDEFECQENETRDDHRIVKMAENWDKVGDQIERQQYIANGEPEEDLRQPRCPGVFEDEPIDAQLVFEGSRYCSQPLGE